MEIEGPAVRGAPGSTFAFVAVANEIKVQTAELLARRDVLPAVITSASVVGEERSNALFDAAYSDHATRLAHIIDPGGGAVTFPRYSRPCHPEAATQFRRR